MCGIEPWPDLMTRSASQLRRLRQSSHVFGVTGAIVAAIFGLAVAGCSQGGDTQAQDDALKAARRTDAALNKTGAALDQAAADTKATVNDLAVEAKPGLEHASRQAKQGLDKLTVAAGRATVKAGATLEHVGERSQMRDAASNRSD